MMNRIEKTVREYIMYIGKDDIIDSLENKSLNQYTTDNKELDLRFSNVIKQYTKLFDVTLSHYEYELYVSGSSWDTECDIRIYAVINLIEKPEAFEKRKASSELNKIKSKEKQKKKLEKEREKELAELKRLKEKYENGGIT